MKLVTGMRVKAVIDDVVIDDAKVYVDRKDRIYICQNQKDGSEADDKLGYKYSWVVTGVNEDDHTSMNRSDVTNFEVVGESMENLKTGDILVPKNDVEKDHYLVLGVFNYSGEDRVAYLEIYDNSMDRGSMSLEGAKTAYYVKGDIPEEATIKEVTLEEVAKTMGIDVKKLRIKD